MPPRGRNSTSSIFPPPKSPDEERVERLANELRGVRASIRVMNEQVRRARSAWEPSSRVKRRAALIYELCGDTKWATVFVRMHQRANMHRTIRMPRNTTPHMIMDWWQEVRQTANFQQARQHVHHQDRRTVDDLSLIHI